MSEQNFFDLDFRPHDPQFDADVEAPANAERVDDFPAANFEPDPEQEGNFEADSFAEEAPDTAETSSEVDEEQAVALVDHIVPSESCLVPENEINRSSHLTPNSDVGVPGFESAQDPIGSDSEAATGSVSDLVQSQVPGTGAGPQHIPIAAGVQIVVPASAANISGNQIPRSIAPNAPSTTGVQQPPATTNTGARRRGGYVPKIQTRPPRTRGPLQQRPIPVWPEFIHVTPAVRANAAGHEAALWMITHARNVPGLKTLGNTDLITSSTRSGDTPGDWKPVVIANFLNEWISHRHGLVLWKKEGKTFREQINWYDRRPLMEQADIRIFITEQVEALLPAADQQRIAQLRQNYQSPASQLATQVANGTWQPPIFGPPSAAFLAEVAAHDAAATAAQVNSGTQMNQMGSGLGGGPVVGTGGGLSSSQPPAGSGGSGASSSAAGGIQAPQPPGNNQEDSRKRGREDEDSEDGVIVVDADGEEPQPDTPPRRKKTRRAGAGPQSNLQVMGGASIQDIQPMRNSSQPNSSSRQSRVGRRTQEDQCRNQGQNTLNDHRTTSQTRPGSSLSSNMHGTGMYPDPELYEMGPLTSRSLNNDFDTLHQHQQAGVYTSFSTPESAGMPYIDSALYGYGGSSESAQQSAFGYAYQTHVESFAQPSRHSEPGTMSLRDDGENQNLELGNYTYPYSTRSDGGMTQGQQINGFSDYPYGMNDGGSSIYGHMRNPDHQEENDDGWSVPEMPEDGSDGFW